jgi:hypothetical protein
MARINFLPPEEHMKEIIRHDRPRRRSRSQLRETGARRHAMMSASPFSCSSADLRCGRCS